MIVSPGRLMSKKSISQPVAILPKVGPFENLASVPISGLSNLTLNGGDISSSTYSNPFKYNSFTISEGDNSVNPTAAWAFFAWTNHFFINFDATLSARGGNGRDGGSVCEVGGNGGSGGTGGGGGGAFYNPCCGCGGANGGAGGDIDNPEGHSGDGFGASGGFGGSGFGQIWAGAYDWPDGDASESGRVGGPGFGGGGDGGQAFPSSECCVAVPSGGGGGGGGGKLICIVTNYTTFNNLSSAIDVSGGLGGNPLESGTLGSNGGNGSIIIMTRQWSNPPTTIIGNIEVWEINHAGNGITRRLDYASASWDNN